MSLAQDQIERHSEKIPFGGCWVWTSSLTKSGYGQLVFKGTHKTAHRASFEAFNRPLINNEWVLHRCDNRSCVNPHHLYAGNAVDNRRDMLERSGWRHAYAKRTHCVAGHEYSPENTSFSKDKSRVCKECQKLKKRIYRSKK